MSKTIIKRHNWGESSPEGLSKTSVTNVIIKKNTNKHYKPIWHNKILNNKTLKSPSVCEVIPSPSNIQVTMARRMVPDRNRSHN